MSEVIEQLQAKLERAEANLERCRQIQESMVIALEGLTDDDETLKRLRRENESLWIAIKNQEG